MIHYKDRLPNSSKDIEIILEPNEKKTDILCTVTSFSLSKTFNFPALVFDNDCILEVHLVSKYPSVTGRSTTPITRIGRVVFYFKQDENGNLIYFAARPKDISGETHMDVMHMVHLLGKQLVNSFELTVMKNICKRSNHPIYDSSCDNSVEIPGTSDAYIYLDPLNAARAAFEQLSEKDTNGIS